MTELIYLGLAVIAFNLTVLAIAAQGARNARRWERGERQG